MINVKTYSQVNYNESKISEYMIPNLLISENGRKIQSSVDWINTRRPEILELFGKYVYGKVPKHLVQINFKVSKTILGALCGRAKRKEVIVSFTNGKDTIQMNILIFLPINSSKAVPLFLGMDFYGNQTIHTDTNITITNNYKAIPIFDDPTVFVCVVTCSRMSAIKYPYQVYLNIATDSIKCFEQKTFTVSGSSDEPFKRIDAIYGRIMQHGAFSALDNYFFVKDVGFNYWTVGRGKKRGGNSIGDRVFYSGKQLHSKDIPFLKGRDIYKWYYHEPKNFLKHDFDKYLNNRIDTFRYSQEFLEQKPKIVYRQTANTIIASIDPSGHYLDKTVHLIVPKRNWDFCSAKLLLGLLNSKLFAYFYSYLSQETEGRTFAQVKTTYIKKLPIPINISDDKINSLVDQIYTIKKRNPETDTNALEREIDLLVYSLYGLTEEEIEIVEGRTSAKK